MRWFLGLALVAVLGALGLALLDRLSEGKETIPSARSTAPIPVEVAPVVLGKIVESRTFSGQLEALETITVAPKVAGRIEKLAVDLADEVKRGETVAILDSAEFRQSVAQAEAEQKVALARVTEAEKAIEIAKKQIERIQNMQKRGLSADVDLESATIDHLRAQASLDVARAEATRAEAAVEVARIREGYTRVTCDWSDEDEVRVVGERLVNVGDTVSANTPLLRVVRLHPIRAVVFVTERDYGDLRVGQSIHAVTDAHPDRVFEGKVRRIAPVFRQNSRQARIEIQLDNEDHALKPGMFVRVTIDLREAENVAIVPDTALTKRGEELGVFLISPDELVASWHPVKIGLREGEKVQVVPALPEGGPIEGRVVTLGQQLLEDGARVAIPPVTGSVPKP